MVGKETRPSLVPALERLVTDLVATLPPFAGLSPDEILIVALSAHGTAAASVRGLDDCAQMVSVDGKRRRWELGLRPPFFCDGDATRRLGTLIHELLHLNPNRPGQLLEEKRHAVRSHAEHEREAEALAQIWLDEGHVELIAPLGHHGEVLMRQWRHRPIPETRTRSFSDHDVMLSPLYIQTPADRRSVWW